MTSEFGIAVHALVYLNHKNTIVSSEELAENICTNPARVRKIINKLKKGNLIKTKEGADGGYCLIKNANRITLKYVSDLMEVKFVSSSWKSGDVDMNCVIASGMGDIMDNIYSQLNDICKKELENITIGDIDKKIFN